MKKFVLLVLSIFLNFPCNGICSMNETQKGRFETLNKMGWAIGPEDEYSQKFIEYAVSNGEWNLEIGAAFGITAKEAILSGAKLVVNDLEKKHLEIFYDNMPIKYHSSIQLKPGNILSIDLTPNHFKGILASRILHMLTGKDIDLLAKKMYLWLKKGGKVFIVAGTPYQKGWMKFLSEYKKRKKSKILYPGEINNVPLWNNERADKLPKFVHLLDIEVLEQIFVKNGFIVEKSGYIDRGTKTKDNMDMGNKKESLGLILIKK